MVVVVLLLLLLLLLQQVVLDYKLQLDIDTKTNNTPMMSSKKINAPLARGGKPPPPWHLGQAMLQEVGTLRAPSW